MKEFGQMVSGGVIFDHNNTEHDRQFRNEERYNRRHARRIKDALDRHLKNTPIEKSSESAEVPIRSSKEYSFQHDRNTGIQDIVHPGNDRFEPGDRINIPEQQGGSGSGEGEASPDGEGEDSFVYVSKEDLKRHFFDHLELPNEMRKTLVQTDRIKKVQKGIAKDGTPARLHMKRTVRQRIARTKTSKYARQRRIEALERELEKYLDADGSLRDDAEQDESVVWRYRELLRLRNNRMPYIIEQDLRYRAIGHEPEYTSRAVMFCVMDVSGSMSEEDKSIAKDYFRLLYMFLESKYEHVVVEYIRHTTTADRVDYHEFFYGKKSGGTIVSSAFQLVGELIREEYPPESWNCYGSQICDGEDWPDDASGAAEMLNKDLMPSFCHFAYIEIPKNSRDLWNAYLRLKAEWEDRFDMRQVHSSKDIWPVFSDLFKRRTIEVG